MVRKLAGFTAAAALVLSAQTSHSFEKEEALGAQLAAEVRRNVPLLEDPAALAYVQRIAAAVAAELPGSWPKFKIELLAGGGGPLQEPVGLPGGYLFVRAGLFRTASNEAEFAGMLAHSMAHAAARHGTRQATRGELINHSSIPLMFMGGWDGLHGSAPLAAPLAFQTAQRDFELEADSIAAQAMARAGYDPETLASYIERLQPGPAPPAGSPLLPRDKRLAALRAAIAALPAREYTAGTGEFERVRDSLPVPAEPPSKPPTLRRPQ